MIQHIVPIYFLRNGIQTVIEMVQEEWNLETAAGEPITAADNEKIIVISE